MTRLIAVPTVKDRTPREMSSMLRPLLGKRGLHGKGEIGLRVRASSYTCP
jgi:hypothetical protein